VKLKGGITEQRNLGGRRQGRPWPEKGVKRHRRRRRRRNVKNELS